MPYSHAGWESLSNLTRTNMEKQPVSLAPSWSASVLQLQPITDIKGVNFLWRDMFHFKQTFCHQWQYISISQDHTCTHATNGGKQRVLRLNKAFMLSCSASLILTLSSLGFWFSISSSIPANRELNNCLATTGSLWREMGRKTFNLSEFLACYLQFAVQLAPVLPGKGPEVEWWGYCMKSECQESPPHGSYDRESPEPLFAVFDRLFLPVRHSVLKCFHV